MKDCEEKDAKVIVKSNEHIDYEIGHIIDPFHKVALHHTTAVPLVLINGKKFICFGKVVKWSYELEKKLKTLEPYEQWNFLSDNYKMEPKG